MSDQAVVDRPVDVADGGGPGAELNGQGDDFDGAMPESPQAEQLALPTFEGLKPTGATVSFSGSVNVPSSAESVTFDDGEVYFLVKGTVSSVSHRRKSKVGLVRDQGVMVEELIRIDDFEAVKMFRDRMPTVDISHRHTNEEPVEA